MFGRRKIYNACYFMTLLAIVIHNAFHFTIFNVLIYLAFCLLKIYDTHLYYKDMQSEANDIIDKLAIERGWK